MARKVDSSGSIAKSAASCAPGNGSKPTNVQAEDELGLNISKWQGGAPGTPASPWPSRPQRSVVRGSESVQHLSVYWCSTPRPHFPPISVHVTLALLEVYFHWTSAPRILVTT